MRGGRGRGNNISQRLNLREHRGFEGDLRQKLGQRQDAQRAPAHSSSNGALLRLCEAICDLCRFYCDVTDAWPSRPYSQNHSWIVGGGVSAGILSFHVTVTLWRARVRQIVPVESWLLPLKGIRWVIERGRLLLPTGSCEHCESLRMIRLFHGCVNFFRYTLAATLSHYCNAVH